MSARRKGIEAPELYEVKVSRTVRRRGASCAAAPSTLIKLPFLHRTYYVAEKIW